MNLKELCKGCEWFHIIIGYEPGVKEEWLLCDLISWSDENEFWSLGLMAQVTNGKVVEIYEIPQDCPRRVKEKISKDDKIF